ncbi:S8 family serine peptidase [Scytonema hofmannii FACHB-248]|uniref:S8 family serine peptidase n=1 Tax=Scytonema hofmannii FACHB-248 TaxID=1842502 RepID=A0ABR8GVH6_9CYAN|nr:MULTISPECIES: S8 family serine peptidase [Nostocales]MBD2607059.1 S8 family serine peptidase [Scytonema hofmannii FACHB-248]
MKRIFSILLAAGIWSLSSVPLVTNTSAIAQTQENSDLFYLYKGQRIPLNQRPDAIAVAFKKVGGTRDRTAQPLYLQLQQALQGGTRGTTPPKVSPLGANYALVSLPSGVRDVGNAFVSQIQQQPYVQTTLPVLSRSERQEVIVLPNEIIISFEPQLDESQRQTILQQNNLAMVRPLRFNRDRYIVKSTSADGTKILSISNQLNQVKGVTSAAPNFIQTVTHQNLQTTAKQASLKNSQPFANFTQGNMATQSTRSISPKSNLLGLAWQLNSIPLKQCLQQSVFNLETLQSCLQQAKATKSTPSRTDIRVTDAWKRSNGGRGVVVAVIDSLIEWEHPDLANSLYTVKAADKCPGEVHGWDFSAGGDSANPCENGDADTRISTLELAILGSKFQDTFQLSDAKLVEQYSTYAIKIKKKNPDYSLEEIANALRGYIRHKIGGEFHGTWVSGVIAAKPENGQGVVGVAPNAQILPVRVFGLDGSIVTSAYIEAIGYAADRGADVINLSLGSSLPSEGEEEAIASVLKAHPKLVIVAAAGNENSKQVAFPAAYPGVVAVGAINIMGDRAPYSNYGKGLDLVAPGGDLNTPGMVGGIPTTGGTWRDAFWQGVSNPTSRWSSVVDPRGKYWWVQGTSFASPAVAGVVALMKGENSKLNREGLVSILKSTASYEGLNISDEDAKSYRSKGAKSDLAKDKQYFFGNGLVNADAAVKAVKQKR